MRGDLASAVAGAGAEIEQVVGRPDNFSVVLDQHQGVAQIAQVRQRAEQPAVVARVQPDRRLVQDVQDAGESAADLAGQTDALRFAAGKRRRRPAERQVLESDIHQELQSVGDLAEQLAGYLPLVLRELQLLEEDKDLAERQSRTSLRGCGRQTDRRPHRRASASRRTSSRRPR